MAELKPTKPVLFTMLGEEAEVPADVIADLRAAGVPFYRSPERAMRALRRLGKWQALRVADVAPVEETRVRLPSGTIPEYLAKPILSAAGIQVPRSALATTLEEAMLQARSIGYPVALKAQAAALSHKSDAGGVALNISDGAALEQAWTLMQDTVRARRPDLTLDGILVEPMSARGLEVILGARNDSEWGPVIMVGLGGVMAEILHDARVLPADLDASSIAEEIRKLRAAPLFDGFRGDAPRDVAALATMAAALGNFVRRHPEIVEVDVNPVMVFEDGKGALALDAVIVTRVTD
jgi:acyl-CoA synthetase (NDP forming)